jgi:hypothetical protein
MILLSIYNQKFPDFFNKVQKIINSFKQKYKDLKFFSDSCFRSNLLLKIMRFIYKSSLLSHFYNLFIFIRAKKLFYFKKKKLVSL